MDNYDLFGEEENTPPSPPPQPAEKSRGTGSAREFLQGVDWRGRVLPAFWTWGAGLSIFLNIVLIIILLILSQQLFAIKSLVQDHFVAGLYENFILMDRATIVTTVVVDDTIPVQFDLRVNKHTTVELTEATHIDNAQVSLRTGGLNIINAPTDIVLPAGTRLPIVLDMVVPVDTTIPVRLTVPVDIPLTETELHEPFVGLQEVIGPLYWLLEPVPDSWGDFFCQFASIGCP